LNLLSYINLRFVLHAPILYHVMLTFIILGILNFAYPSTAFKHLPHSHICDHRLPSTNLRKAQEGSPQEKAPQRPVSGFISFW